MIDKNKIKLMTKIVMEDESAGLSKSRFGNADLGDYLFIQGFFSFIAYTVAFFILTACIAIININSITNIFIYMRPKDLIFVYLAVYLSGLILYEICCSIYFYKKYRKNIVKIKRNTKRISILKKNFFSER